MSIINDGGLAFPGTRWEEIEHPKGLDPQPVPHPGMTLLDYFAGQALAGMDVSYIAHPDSAAQVCYEIAEAMLAVRERRMKEAAP